jgi:hypothetical protein
MKKKILLIIIIPILIILILLGSFYLLNKKKEERIENEIKSAVEKFQPSFVDDCENIMLKEDLTYAICCLSPENKIYRCDKISFAPGEYIGAQVNIYKLNNLNNKFSTYYVCVFSDLPFYGTSYPLKYGQVEVGKVLEPVFLCSPLFYQKDYHHQALSGFVLNKPGKYTLLKIWLFDGNYPPDFDFKSNLDKGLKVFDFPIEIK